MKWRKGICKCWASSGCYSPAEFFISLGWSFQCISTSVRVFTDTNSSLGRDSSVLKATPCPIRGDQPLQADSCPWTTPCFSTRALLQSFFYKKVLSTGWDSACSHLTCLKLLPEHWRCTSVSPGILDGSG